MLRIIDVDYIQDYQLLITFNDGNRKRVSTQFRAYPFERALFSALNRVSLKISFEN